jgi:hypothetical protein
MIRKSTFFLAPLAFVAFATFFAASAPALDLPPQGMGRGGPFRAQCNAGFMVGFTGRVGAWIDNLRPICATWNGRQLVNPTSHPFQVGLSQGGGPASASCPNFIGQIVLYDTKGDGPTDVMHHIDFQCFTSTSVDEGWRQYGSSTKTESRDTGLLRKGYTGQFVSPCPRGQAAVGLHGRHGSFVDALGLICEPMPAVAPPPQAAAPPPAVNPAPIDTSKLRDGPLPAARALQQQTSATSFTGTWDTRTDKNWSFRMSLTQNGSSLTGTYVAQDGTNGRISGTVTGGVLDFNWQQDGGYTGTGRFTLASNTFNGSYRANPHPKLQDPRYLQGTWSGTRR